MPCASQRSEQSLRHGGLAADGERAHDECAEQQDDRAHAEQAQFFRGHGEQEIGVRFRQVEQFFHAAAEADAQPFTATESDQRMAELVALAERDRTTGP